MTSDSFQLNFEPVCLGLIFRVEIWWLHSAHLMATFCLKFLLKTQR